MAAFDRSATALAFIQPIQLNSRLRIQLLTSIAIEDGINKLPLAVTRSLRGLKKVVKLRLEILSSYKKTEWKDTSSSLTPCYGRGPRMVGGGGGGYSVKIIPEFSSSM